MSEDILYPLRRLHGKLHTALRDHRENQAFYHSILEAQEKKVLLLGTPTHSNIGDSAIVLAEHAFLAQCGISPSNIVEVTYEDFQRLHYCVKKALKNTALLCWHGGGNMGTLWPEHEFQRQKGIRKIPASFPSIVFPQTIFFESSPAGECEKKRSASCYNNRSGLTIAARDQRSFQIMQELYPHTDVLLTPDIVLSCNMDTFGVKSQQRSGILLCLRTDKERALEDAARSALESQVKQTGVPWKYTDMHAEGQITLENRHRVVAEKMTEFAASKLVITDRLHGMIFSAITGTPCIVLPNNTHKVAEAYHWISYLPYIHFANDSIAFPLIQKMLAIPEGTYSSAPLCSHFDSLKEQILSKTN